MPVMTDAVTPVYTYECEKIETTAPRELGGNGLRMSRPGMGRFYRDGVEIAAAEFPATA